MAKTSMLGFVAAIALIAIVTSCIDSAVTPREDPAMTAKLQSLANARQAQVAASAVANCEAARTTHRAVYEKLMSEGKFWTAAQTIRECAVVLNDPELKGLGNAAELKDRIATARNPKETTGNRLAALAVIQRDYVEDAKALKLAPLVAELERAAKAEERREAAAIAKRKRSQGVNLGMTQDDVLASSWGKPRKVNRSTYKWGVHEQWVYDGGYLYFEDGVLTAIQN